MSLIQELKRRNVLRVGIAYIVTAWLVIQVVETLFPVFDLGNESIRIVVVVLAIGLFPALVVSWIFELTPDGLKRDSEIDHSRSIAPKTGKNLDRMIIVVLAAALTFFGFDKFVLQPARDAELTELALQAGRSAAIAEGYGDKSIAVLPFVDMSQGKDQQYLAEGLSEELLNLLARVPELRVASRSSAFNLRDSGLSVPEMAAKLGVVHVLEGSVRFAGDQLRVTVQLIDADSDTHLWSQTYDRQFENVFAIQDDIAANVVDELKVTILGDAPKIEEVDPESYKLELQASHLMRRRHKDESARVTQLFEQAIAIDPNNIRAWRYLADAYQRRATFGTLPEEEALQKARAALNQALKLNPGDPGTLRMLGWMEIRWTGDIEEAARYIQKAVDLTADPVEKVHVAEDLLMSLGRYELLLEFQSQNIAKDPTQAVNYYGYATLLYFTGNFEACIENAQTAVLLNAKGFYYHGILAECLVLTGRYEPALEAVQKEVATWLTHKYKIVALEKLGRTEEAGTAWAALENDELSHPSEEAWIYTQLGQHDKAFEALDRLSIEDGEFEWRALRLFDYAPLHDDPRWQIFKENVESHVMNLDEIEFDVPWPEEWKK
jgi:TolB-like protein/Flp pilus assembly protein TadD